jgi:hypothetical protein
MEKFNLKRNAICSSHNFFSLPEFEAMKQLPVKRQIGRDHYA